VWGGTGGGGGWEAGSNLLSLMKSCGGVKGAATELISSQTARKKKRWLGLLFESCLARLIWEGEDTNIFRHIIPKKNQLMA